MANRHLTFASVGLLALLAGCGGGGGGSSNPPPPPPSDSTPDTITLAGKSDAPLSTPVSSSPVTITGINIATPISITGGEYSIGGGAFTSAPGTVSNNQSVTVRVASSGQFSTSTNAVLTVGGVSVTFTATTLAEDKTPDAFQFTAGTNAALNAVLTSGSVAISGINTGTPIGVTNGEYSIEGGAWTSVAGTITNNQHVAVRLTTSAQFSTAVNAVLTIGGVSATFTGTTLAEDKTPDAFSFPAVGSGAARNVVLTSNSVTISGINTVTPISIASGEYSIDGGAYTNAAGTISNNQHVTVRLTTSGQFSTAVIAVLTVGSVTGAFSATTLAADLTPDDFQFQPVVDVVRVTPVTSGSVAIHGINASAPVSITGGEYSIDGGPFTSATGSIDENQQIRVRLTSSSQFLTGVDATLTVGTVARSFTVTTYPEDTTPDAFQFQGSANNVRGEWVLSNAVTITGINNSSPVTINNGEYSVAGGAFRSTAGLVEPGQTLQVRTRASQVYTKSATSRVTVGGVSADHQVRTELPNYLPDAIDFDGADIVYLLNAPNHLVFRWSLGGARYLDPYELSRAGGQQTAMVYSAAHKRLYVGDDAGAIRYFDPASASPVETPFTTMAARVDWLGIAGKFLTAQVRVGYNGGFVLDRDGVVTSPGGYYSGYSQQNAWDPVSSRVYYYRDGISPNDLHYDLVDQTTGIVGEKGETPYHGDYNFYGPIRVSVNGQNILLGTGDIYARNGLTHTGWLGGQIADARWLADGSLVTLGTAAHQTVLRHLSGTNLRTLEQLPFTGDTLRLVGTDEKMAVIVNDAGVVKFNVYVPSDDSDGDGVANAADAFPVDAAASVDTDHDGYPDAWNDGKTAADSTTGLAIDAFPKDSACWLASHGSANACDFGATLPDYEPTQVTGQGGIVYLLSSANRRVYRWSISTEKYLDPYVVGIDQGFSTLAPIRMAYSNAQQRLYLGYDTGEIRYIDVTAANPVETPFASVGARIVRLTSAGNFLVAQVNGSYYSYDVSNVINGSGVITAQGSSYLGTTDTAWDPVTSRLYYVVNSTSIYYEVMNQTTGAITSSGLSTGGSTYLTAPARVSVDGQRILLGSGDLFAQAGLAWTGTLGAAVTDARWFADGSLTTLSTDNVQTVLRRLDGSSLGTTEQLSYSGRALRVVGSDSKMALVLFDGHTVQFKVYVPDDDRDDDGVNNTQDAFPLDAAASVDSDGDGYPDAWNTGKSQPDSTTGLTLDAFPQDSACWLVIHGSGGVCNYAATVPAFVPDKIEQGGDVIYLLSSANRRVYRWSLSAKHYINPYIVGINQGVSPIVPGTMSYSGTRQRLYLGYPNGAIQYIDLAAPRTVEVPFTTLPPAVISLAYAGNFLLAQSNSSYGGYVLDASGNVTARGGYYYGYSRETAWDPNNSRVYYFHDGLSPNDLSYDVINQTTGLVTGSGETPYHGDFNIGGVARVTTDGQYVLVGSGDIFSRDTLTWSGSVGGSVVDARWLANGSVVTLVTSAGQTQLRRLGSTTTSPTVLEQASFAGEALRVLGTDAEMVVLVNNNGTLQFNTYVPNNDSDGDGVSNTVDAFPQDRAASVDTDHDGYPDAWNAGRGPADSTSVPALVLDAFPGDSACWLPSHAGAGGVCNPAATVPNYIPDQVVQGGDVVYLLSSANRRVYRWSISAGAYLNPHVVGINQGFTTITPTTMAYSAAQQRLYLGYSSGAIRYIDVTAATPLEAPFVTMSNMVSQLNTAGSFVVAQLGPFYNSYRYVFDNAGVTRDQSTYYWSAYESTWDPVNSRMYYSTSGSYSLYYDVLDQATGKFSVGSSTTFGGGYPQLKVRVSPDGQRILLGSADVLRTNGLTWLGMLGTQFADARWFADGSVVEIVGAGTTLTNLQHLGSANYSSLETRQYAGQPLRIFGTDTKMAVLVINNGAVQFISYVPSNDSDGDGVLNTADAFPNDAAASVDADGDGHPDSWNAGKGAADSTTGLSLDLFPTEPTCWAASHGSGGVCNYAATVGNYRPDRIEQNGDIVYLLSSANRLVYRWSIATGTYLRPYVVGANTPYGSLAPTAMAYSPSHQRLYLGYQNGVIRYLDVNAVNPAETPFITISGSVNGLSDAGNFLVAQPVGNAGPLLLNSSGATLDTGYSYYSTETAWDPVNSRIYFAQNGTLVYQVIDQTTGKMGATGASAYTGQAYAGPVRVSEDGSQIIVGNGNVYSSNGPTLTGSLGKSIGDAHWMGNLLVDVDRTAQVEIRDATTRTVLQTYQQLGAPLRLVFGTSDAYLVHFLNDSTVSFWRMPFYDEDGDTIPRWWEQLYAQGGSGMSDSSAADATGDLDGDGVNNLSEYQHRSNPLVNDSDGDGLSDLQEIATYHTDPGKTDTDGDGLGDYAEVNTHHTDPLDTDSDNDNYSDLVEVMYGGNPNDGTVLPQPITSYTQGFENNPNLTAWIVPPQTNAAWGVDTTNPHSGSASFRSGAIGYSQSSATRLRGFFRSGTLSFWTRVDQGYCCNRMIVSIDGVPQLTLYGNSTWYSYSLQVPLGVHEIEWRFERDYQGGQPLDSAWIDDIVFTGQ